MHALGEGQGQGQGQGHAVITMPDGLCLNPDRGQLLFGEKVPHFCLCLLGCNKLNVREQHPASRQLDLNPVPFCHWPKTAREGDEIGRPDHLG